MISPEMGVVIILGLILLPTITYFDRDKWKRDQDKWYKDQDDWIEKIWRDN